MITGLDSAYPPTASQVAQAKAAGYGAWLGYFSGPGILNGWSKANFDTVKAGGLQTAAYCSGWADAAAMKAQSASWVVPIILDDESGIRSLKGATALEVSGNRVLARSMMHGGTARPVLERDAKGIWTVSSWVQPWLDTSGSGQYGNQPVFAGVHARCYVFAAYPGGDPGVSWPPYYARPADGHPCAWQFQGTHSIFGIGVDTTHFDDKFWATGPSPSTEDDMLYLSSFKPNPTTLKAFAAAVLRSDPSNSALQVGTLASGASIGVTGYCFSNSGLQSSDRGAGAGAGIDYVWWQTSSGAWVADADLVTTGVAGLPIGVALSVLPSGMKLYFAKESELAGITGSGVTMAQVTSAISDAIGRLPAAGLTKDQVDAEIMVAIGNLPKPAPGGAHHHGVLGIINTGPVVSD